uniref:RNA-directed RNA polymerase n=1 Tax=Stinn virus TaxID=2800944 RepID=A0A894KLC2_9VIRU|nr:MAG: RNA-dependent RNA polymerase [Stinn virus]
MLHWTEPPAGRILDVDAACIVVDAQYRSDFKFYEGVMYCRQCVKITSSVNKPWLSRTIPGDTSAPLVPTRLLHPHLCTITTVKRIQNLYEMHHISYELFSSWFALNGGEYQMGDSKQCMALWRDFTHRPYAPEVPTHIEALLESKPRAIRLVRCDKHKGQHLVVDWGRIRNDAEYDWLDAVWRWSSEADKAKTTLSAGQLVKHISREEWARLRLNKFWRWLSVGLPNVTVTAMLMHILGNPEADRNFELLSKYRYCCLDQTSYQELFKALSIAIRRTSHHPDGRPATLSEITSMAGWELAIGRSRNKTDWPEERRKRTECTLYLGHPLLEQKTEETNKTYLDEMRVELRAIMGQLVGKPKRNPSWNDYVMDRQSWLSSGSTGGLKVKLEDGTEIRANKHTLFETITAKEMLGWLVSEPMIKATASEKFEMGKARAIYGTGVVDYSVHSYALEGVEVNLSRVDGIEYGLSGKAVLATMIRRMAVVTGTAAECTNVDYADFNYQHTLGAQAAVYEELAKSLALAGWHEDKVKAAEWCRDSLLKQYVKFPELRTGYIAVSQGMFSGFRGTNFLNTLANVAYFRVAARHALSLFGLQPENLYHSHLGDDVFIANKSRLWAVVFFNCMSATGLVFQPAKQMFEVSKGEFLRVVYTEEGCQGYVARKVATFIMKPIQNTDVLTPAERAVALNDQIGALTRRGFLPRAAALIWDAVIPYAASSTLGGGRLSIPKSILIRHHLDNGLDLGHPFTAAARASQIPQLPVMKLESKVMARSLPTYMTDDWLRTVSRRFGRPFDIDGLREVVHNINMTDSLRQEDRLACLRAYERAMRDYKVKVKLDVVSRNAANFEALKEGKRASAIFWAQLEELGANKVKKGAPTERSTLGCIMSCVGQSAFKSIATTMVATKSNAVDALLLCLSQAVDSENKDRACFAVASILNVCGPEILCCIVGGVGAGAGKYGSEFHPDVLSWIQSEALEITIWRAVAERVISLNVFRRMVDDDFDCHVRSARDHGLLKSMSRY